MAAPGTMAEGGAAPLDNVERARVPDRGVLERAYLRQGRPVVLTGFVGDARAARLADPDVARTELAEMRLQVRRNPLSEFVEGRRDPPLRTTTFGRFLRELDAGSAEVCIEHDTPPCLAAYLRGHVLGAPAASRTFLAGRGSTVHLHYDMDQRDALMYQVFGRKRYVIIDPAETRKLVPAGSPNVPYLSGLVLQNFSASDLAAFLRYVNAWDCVVEPGETLLIPAAAWHYVEYVDTALSVSFRYARNRYTELIARALPLPSVEAQALGAAFRDEQAIGPAHARAVSALRSAAARVYPSTEARDIASDLLGAELCALLGLPVAGPPYHLADRDRRDQVARDARALAGSGAEPRARPGRGRSRRRPRASSGRSGSPGWW